MPQIIGGLYEIQQQIGAGGGGIVYLGVHTRLHKPVVLKADKRQLSVGMEALRREVDLLKRLSHTYIPQVYDFVQEDGIVYTVMDYIDGESFDKILKRGERPTQPQVLHWAIQLLEALDYLHSQPPYGILHGDIKPANIMLRPNGDVCLIDYNIALALGENGAVKVGFSRGYASPEHYGIEYASPNHRQPVTGSDVTETDDRTLADTDERTQADTANTRTRGMVRLDVRSDIYSLGATLYHLISGVRPPQDAPDVAPLGEEVCSRAVSDILKKAMEPDPRNRYQTAQEMLDAIRGLYKSDPRAVRLKHQKIASAAVCAGIFLAGGAVMALGQHKMEQTQEYLTKAEYSADALAQGDVTQAVTLALEALPSGQSIGEGDVTPQAQLALTNALGVYELSDGYQDYDTISVGSNPFDLALSPDGTYLAVVTAYQVQVYETATLTEVVSLPTQESALSDVVFCDAAHMIYAGEDGITCYDLHTGTTVWTGAVATGLALSGDASRVAAVDRDADHAVVYNVSDGSVVAQCSFYGCHRPVAANDIFADPQDSLFALDQTGEWLAVSYSGGGLMILDVNDPANDLIVYDDGDSEYSRYQGGFYGSYLAYAADGSSLQLIDVQEGAFLGESSMADGCIVETDADGIYIANASTLVSLDPATMEERELAYLQDAAITAFTVGEDYVMAAGDDGSFRIFDRGANAIYTSTGEESYDFLFLSDSIAGACSRNTPTIRLMSKVSHADAQLMSYDPFFTHDEVRLSADGQTVMLFHYEHFAVYKIDGTQLCEVELPDADTIYDQQFRRENDTSYLEVIWYDGTRRQYSALDGTLLSEEIGEAPDTDLYEEFYTDQYRIASTLHSAPEVYEIGSGRLVTTLEEDAYLTYVTQIGDQLLTEYMSAEGERYGLLLDDDLEQIARLPDLCDATSDGWLLFDYSDGNLRQCRLYSLSELEALGETYIK